MTQVPKFTLPQLALMEWLVEAPNLRFFVRSRWGLTLLQIVKGAEGELDKLKRISVSDDKEMIARLGGRAKFDDHPIYKAGFIQNLHMFSNKEAYERFASRFAKNAFHYDESLQRPRQAMVDFFNAHGRDQLAAMREKKAAELAAVERFVVIACDHYFETKIPRDVAKLLPENFRLPIGLGKVRQPYALARVVKESETRVYVADVKPYFEVGYRANPVSGSASGAYVERSSIMLDPASPEAMGDLVGVFNEQREAVNARVIDTLREIAPALNLLQNKLLQGAAMYDDLIREVLERHSVSAAGPKP